MSVNSRYLDMMHDELLFGPQFRVVFYGQGGIVAVYHQKLILHYVKLPSFAT